MIQFNADPVFGYDARAFTVGRLPVRNRVTASDDSLNSWLPLTVNVEK